MARENSSEVLLKRAYSLASDEEAHALYRDWAETYDETMLDGLKYLTPTRTAKLLVASNITANDHVLDVGCGTGLAGQALAHLGLPNIDGLDYSAEMLETAREKHYEGRPVYSRLLQSDLNAKLPIEDGEYDHLICTGTFTHAHVGAECLYELIRILKIGGKFACTIHKDVWVPAGFSKIVDDLIAKGMMQTHFREMGTYFETDDAPQGWYIVWEKTR